MLVNRSITRVREETELRNIKPTRFFMMVYDNNLAQDRLVNDANVYPHISSIRQAYMQGSHHPAVCVKTGWHGIRVAYA